jgi:uncharacterized membrane protein (UPF0127 family)
VITRTALQISAAMALVIPGACAREAAPEPPETTAPAAEAAPAVPPTQAAPAAVPLPPDAPRVTPGPTEALTIVTAKGPVDFQVEIADDDAERAQGLMWRTSMPANRGMLFDFVRESPQAFWMHNTYLPLDLIFIRSDGRIHSIARNARTLDDTPIPSGGPVQAVLEINAGLAERLGINPGDMVRHRIFR